MMLMTIMILMIMMIMILVLDRISMLSTPNCAEQIQIPDYKSQAYKHPEQHMSVHTNYAQTSN